MKTILKKTIALLLTAAMLCSMIGAAFAAGSPTVSISSVKNVAPGDEVTLKVSISNNPGFWMGTVDIKYDTGLTYVGYEDLRAFSDLPVSVTASNPIRLTWADLNREELHRENGDMVTLTFKVPDDAKNESTYNVEVSDIEMTDLDGDVINSFTGSDGKITVVTDEQYKITADAGYNGSISPTSAMVGEGGSQTFTIST